MADLDIRKKRRYPVLWALLGLLAVAMIVWFFTADSEEGLNENNGEMFAESEKWGDDSNAAVTAEYEPEVENYLDFTNDLGTIALDHEATHRGLTELAGALSVITENQENEIEQLRQEADQLMDDRLSDQHAGIMKNAFVSAATIIQNQSREAENFSEESSEVMKAAEAIDETELATNQKNEIKNFFEQSASAVRELQTEQN